MPNLGMNAIPWYSLAPACLLLKKITFFGLIFKLNDKPIKYQFHLVQHGANIWSKDTDVIKIQQQGNKLLITKTLHNQPAEA